MQVYRQADLAFCIALSNSDQPWSLMKLFFANRDRTGQGSFLFEAKPNVSLDDYTTVLNIESDSFVRTLKDTFEAEHGEEYDVILRRNNEGAAVGVIKGFEAIFKDKLVGVLGSLADVAKVHGQPELDALFASMDERDIQFTPLFSAFTSWPDALAFLRSKIGAS